MSHKTQQKVANTEASLWTTTLTAYT